MSKAANRDYVLVIDKSGSMSTSLGTSTRFEAVKETTLNFARKIEPLDPDGIDLYFFAGSFKLYESVKAADVEQRYQENEPNGGTDLAGVLKDAFGRWEKKGKKPTTILVVTDGEPNDRAAVANEIISVTKKMDSDEQLAVGFFQIGNDKAATGFLKELDDGLEKAGAKFDIVDTKTFDEIESSGKTLSEILVDVIDD